MTPPATRLARRDDLPTLQEIEVAAGALFADVGMQAVADDEPPTLDALSGYEREGRAWVAVDDRDRPVGYALALEVDGHAHLEQLTVHPECGRQGRGRALVETVVGWARAQGAGAITLSTFVDVPWNRPYYERCGFRVLADHELTPALLALRVTEVEHGLDVSCRCFMRRDL